MVEVVVGLGNRVHGALNRTVLNTAARLLPRVAIVDDHPPMLLGIRDTLEDSGQFAVTLMARHGAELVEALEGGAEVDLVVLDLCMPVMDGLATLAWLHEHRPQLGTVAYTFEVKPATVLRCYRSGARGLLCKDCEPEVLVAALNTVLAGGIYHTTESQQVLLENPDGLSPEERKLLRVRAQVTPRQLQVLEILVREDDPKTEQIARELNLSSRTVEGHLSELYDLFGVPGRTSLALAAVRVGLVPL